MPGDAGRQRVIIEAVSPEIDCGRFPIQRTAGERVGVEADAFTDGHDALACRLLWRPESQSKWNETAMEALPNDRWRAEFTPTEQGRWLYSVAGWVDRFKTWRRDLKKRVEAGLDVEADLREGAALVREASGRASKAGKSSDARVLAGLAEDLETGSELPERLELALDDELAQLMDSHADRAHATVYPRELGVVVDRERAGFSSWYEMLDGTLGEREARLSLVEEMGFDVLCLGSADPGEDLQRLTGEAARRGIEIAVDLFPEGQDLKGVLDAWISQGVTAFRVAAPGGVPFPVWEEWIAEVRREHPKVLFLSWDLPRPPRRKVARRLAKLGLTLSRTEIPWSGGASEIRRVFAELAEVRDFLRPCLWPNPPDHPILPIEAGGRPVFVQRLILAATLGACYGLYQLRPWNLEPADSLGELIGLVNRVRRENPALQSDGSLRFHATDNERILCYSKAAGGNLLVMVVNLDPDFEQSAWVSLSLEELGLEPGEPFQVHDLLTGARYHWHGSRNFVRLDPRQVPAHVFRVGPRVL
jgi:starch synthase (maltosyl-transferring)